MNGKIVGDRYKVIEYLAKGGFGTTYLAQDTHLPGDDNCVVKQLNPSSGDAKSLEIARRLFKTEAFTLNNIGHHDQIPELLAYFEENNKFYLVQQYIDGLTLEKELATKAKWSEAEVIELLLDGLKILEFIHSHSVIHRDVKPDNLIRRYSDNKLVLVDFGTVKEVVKEQANPSQLTVAIGTQGYMPTEQARGKPQPASDIYALGAIGIRILTGIVPIELAEDEHGELIWEPAIEISHQLREIVTQMTRYDVQDRYQSAMEVLEALASLSSQSFINYQTNNHRLDLQSHSTYPITLSKTNFATASSNPTPSKLALQEINSSNISAKSHLANATSIELDREEKIPSLPKSIPSKKAKNRKFLGVSIAIAIVLTSIIALGLNYYLLPQPLSLPFFKDLSTPKENNAETNETPRVKQGGGFRRDL